MLAECRGLRQIRYGTKQWQRTVTLNSYILLHNSPLKRNPMAEVGIEPRTYDQRPDFSYWIIYWNIFLLLLQDISNNIIEVYDIKFSVYIRMWKFHFNTICSRLQFMSSNFFYSKLSISWQTEVRRFPILAQNLHLTMFYFLF